MTSVKDADPDGDLEATAEAARKVRLSQYAWVAFEWARNPYVILITIYVFAPYFTRDFIGDPVRGQAIWSYISGAGGFLIAFAGPVLGAIADRGGRRKPWIGAFVLLMVPCTFMLWFAVPGGDISVMMLAVIIIAANLAFEMTAVFHNAMLPTIGPTDEIGKISGWGLAAGNGGALILLVTMLYGIALPGDVDWAFLPEQPWFGLDPTAYETSRIAGPIAAVWMAIFAIPLFIYTPDRQSNALSASVAIRQGFLSLIDTVRKLKDYKNVGVYLLARMLYNDGKTAILTIGGIYASGIFGWGVIEMLIFGIVLTIFAVAGGFFGGWLDTNLGSKRAIFISIGGTMLALVLSVSIGPDHLFFFFPYDYATSGPVWSFPYFQSVPEIVYIGVGFLTAVFITAAYANSRTMLARIAPEDMMAEFFGLYALSGTATAFVAHALVGVFTDVFNSQRAGYASILILLASGLVVMFWVREERAEPQH